MFKKTICVLALAVAAFTQDAAQVNSVVDQAVQAAQTTTVGDAVAQAQAADVNQIGSSVPALNSLTVGWEKREVVVTPQASNPTLNDWLQGNVDVERDAANWDDGEWNLQWSVENGDDYALLHDDNGDFIILDSTTGTRNNWGANDGLDAEIASGAESLVDYVFNNEVDTVQGSTITDWLANVLNNDNVNGFLNTNSGNTVANAATDAANQASGSVGAIVDAANQAGANVDAGQVDAAVDAAAGQV